MSNRQNKNPQPYTGSLVNVEGIVMVFHLGHMIALIAVDGEILVRDFSYPLYLVEYLLHQPSPNKTQWN